MTGYFERHRLEVRRPWSGRAWDRAISVTATAATFAAVIVALYQPRHDLSEKRRSDLVAYRNLACYNARYLEDVLDKAKAANSFVMIDDAGIKAVDKASDAIQYANIYPPQTSEPFVDILFTEQKVLAYARDHLKDSFKLRGLRDEIAGDMAKIDRFALKAGADRWQMEGCLPGQAPSDDP